MQGYQALFEQALTNSWLRKRQDRTDEAIKALRAEISQLKVRDEILQTNIEREGKRQDEALEQSVKKQEETNKSFHSQFKDAFKQISFGKEVAKQ